MLFARRYISFILCTILLLTLCSCGSNTGAAGRKNNTSPSVEDVIESGISREEKQEGYPEPVADSDVGNNSSDSVAQIANDEPVDVDLTAMSSTMVFAEVSSMLAEPDSFMGKSVKMFGQFAVMEDPTTGNVYCACVVKDATACCANGIEFVLEGEPEYPFGYPEVGEEITVTGIFDTYEENGFYYITLRDAHLL